MKSWKIRFGSVRGRWWKLNSFVESSSWFEFEKKMLGSIPKLFKNLYSSAQRTRQEVALKPLSRKPLVISFIPAVTLMRWIFFSDSHKSFLCHRQNWNNFFLFQFCPSACRVVDHKGTVSLWVNSLISFQKVAFCLARNLATFRFHNKVGANPRRSAPLSPRAD